MKYYLSLFAFFILISCSTSGSKSDLTRSEAIQEIYDMEQAFNEMLATEGRAAAFAHFAADNGGIQRGGRMIVGKDSIFAFYDRSTTQNVQLSWKPDRVDVSEDFTMAYTWGKFKFSGTREDGEIFENTGVFHTVWQRQADGTWRYVYD